MSNIKTKTNTSKCYLNLNKKENFTKAEIMFKKRAFIHHYIGEGLEEAELVNALDNIRDLKNEYEAIDNDFVDESKKEDIEECEETHN